VYGYLEYADKCSNAADPYACAVITLDPVYKIYDGAGRLPGDIHSGCGLATATDSAEIIGGAAATVGIAAGGVGLARGFVATPDGPTLSVGDIMSNPQLLSGRLRRR
jgi:hypothetical protein